MTEQTETTVVQDTAAAAALPANRLTYVKGNFFDAPEDTCLVHAVSCEETWSTNVAAQMRAHFPDAYRSYIERCGQSCAKHLLGSALLSSQTSRVNGRRYFVATLFTRRFYNSAKEKRQNILWATHSGVTQILDPKTWPRPRPDAFASPRLNVGLYGVPWEETVSVLDLCLKRHDPKPPSWNVWAP